MSARALHRLFLIACSALLLAGCGLRFAYSQLDWLLPWYLRDYVTLDAGQRGEFDRRLAGLLDWHCRSHLPEYVALLRAANATLAAERVEPAQLERFLERGEALWREIVGELEPELRRLAAGLGDEQVEELAAAFVRRGEEARAEFLSGDESAQHAARVERMEERLRRWFGRMTPAQRERIAAWSRALQPTTEAWLEDRARWQAELLDALRVRADAAAFAPRLAQALAPRVRVVGVAPGLTLTSHYLSEAQFQRLHALSPLGRSSTAQDVAQAVRFALENRALTGTTLLVDGGQHLQRFERDFSMM